MPIKNRYLLPRIDDLFDQIHGATILSKIDLSSSYHQVKIKDKDIFTTTFRTRYGHYEFVVMPFGLTDGTTTFMCLMNSILGKYLEKFVVLFIDNILFYSETKEEHDEHLKIILQVLREHQLHAKFNKCDFYRDKIQYLGHIISEEGISMDLFKIKSIIGGLSLKT